MSGPRYTPEELERAAEVLARTANLHEAARAIGGSVSGVREALRRERIARDRTLHARACEAGLRKGRQALRELGLQLDAYIAKHLTTDSLEPRDVAALARARAEIVATVAKVADREDRRRGAKLERELLRARLAGELVEHHAVTHAGDPLDALTRAVARLAPEGAVDASAPEPDPDPAR